MDFFEFFILGIFLVLLAMAFKNEFYSNCSNEKFISRGQDNSNSKSYPYEPSNYFNNWGWYPYRGLWPYYNPWWFYPKPYPLPIDYNKCTTTKS
jgi:hypothetical protein